MHLDVYSNVLGVRSHIMSFREQAKNYTEIHRHMGGAWQASWEFDEDGYDPDYGKWWFYNSLGLHFERSEGSRAYFSGIVDEVEITSGGTKMRMSLEPVANAVKAIFRRPDGTITEMSSWTTNDLSIEKYGRKEHLLALDWMFPADAQAEVDTYLQEFAFPKPQFVSLNRDAEDSCTVRVSGYIFTTSWKYITVAYTNSTVSDYFTNLITTDAPFLFLGEVIDNAQTISEGPDAPVVVWDELERITKLRDDPTIPPFYVWGDENRYAHFSQLDTTPKYIWDRGALRGALGGDPTDPWSVRPGIVRDVAWGVLDAPYESYFEQGNDFLIEEVRLKDGMEFPILTSTTEDAQYEAAVAEANIETSAGRGRGNEIDRFWYLDRGRMLKAWQRYGRWDPRWLTEGPPPGV